MDLSRNGVQKLNDALLCMQQEGGSRPWSVQLDLGGYTCSQIRRSWQSLQRRRVPEHTAADEEQEIRCG